MQLPKDVYFILNALQDKGYFSVVVGGAVRDYFRGVELSDYDIATIARPEEVKSVFKDFKVVPVGLQYGTVMLRYQHKNYEITTFRKEGAYLDKRHPQEISYIKNLKEDLERRDFTINAIAYSIEGGGKVYDYFDGLTDIKNKIIKAVGIAEERFDEDALRILRALRFSACFSYKIENKTKEAILAKYYLLANLPKERVQVELKKIFLANISWVIREYKEVFSFLFDGLSDQAIKRYLKCEKKIPKDHLLHYALLLLDHPKYHEVIEKYKFSKNEKKIIIGIIEHYNLINEKNDLALIRYLKIIHYDTLLRIFQLKEADGKLRGSSAALNKLITNVHEVGDLKVNGHDLQKLGLKGAKIKETLFLLLEMVVSKKLANDKDEIMKYLTIKFNEKKR